MEDLLKSIEKLDDKSFRGIMLKRPDLLARIMDLKFSELRECGLLLGWRGSELPRFGLKQLFLETAIEDLVSYLSGFKSHKEIHRKLYVDLRRPEFKDLNQKLADRLPHLFPGKDRFSLATATNEELLEETFKRIRAKKDHYHISDTIKVQRPEYYLEYLLSIEKFAISIGRDGYALAGIRRSIAREKKGVPGVTYSGRDVLDFILKAKSDSEVTKLAHKVARTRSLIKRSEMSLVFAIKRGDIVNQNYLAGLYDLSNAKLLEMLLRFELKQVDLPQLPGLYMTLKNKGLESKIPGTKKDIEVNEALYEKYYRSRKYKEPTPGSPFHDGELSSEVSKDKKKPPTPMAA